MHVVGSLWHEANAAALELVEKTGAAYFHPFADPMVVAGQGTVALEILEQMPDVETVLVAIGGGGLISGVGTLLRALKPGVRIIGIEAEGCPVLLRALEAGQNQGLERVTTTLKGPIMRYRPLCILCVLSLPIVAQAQPKPIENGTYDAFDCSPPVSDQRVKIEGTHLSFYETSCEMSNPKSLRGFDNAILYDAICEGEGESWPSRFILMHTADDGLVVMNDVYGDHYQRCK